MDKNMQDLRDFLSSNNYYVQDLIPDDKIHRFNATKKTLGGMYSINYIIKILSQIRRDL